LAKDQTFSGFFFRLPSLSGDVTKAGRTGQQGKIELLTTQLLNR